MPLNTSSAMHASSHGAVTRRLNLRYAFYVIYFSISLFFNKDFASALLTLPMFGTIIASLRYCDSSRVGQLDMISLVYFLFFCIVPLQQVDSMIFLYGEIARNFRYGYFDFVLVHVLALLSFLFFVQAMARSAQSPVRDYTARSELPPVVAAAAVVACLASIYVQQGFVNVLAARVDKQDLVLGQLTPAFLGLQSVGTFFYLAATRHRPSLTKIATSAVLLSLLLLMANPFNVARFALVGVWGPILFLLLPRLLRPAVFYLGSFLILIFLVPLLSLSTRSGSVETGRLAEELSYGSLFTLKNLNTFELSLEAVAYVRRSGLRWGDTFLSTIFTHVPRDWWPAKPIASNLEVGGNLVGFYRYTNENLAVPWFMDGYMDFWIPGSILYSALAGLLFYFLNKWVRFRLYGVEAYSLFFIAGFLILARGTVAVVLTLFLFQVLFLVFVRRSGLIVARNGAISPRVRFEIDHTQQTIPAGFSSHSG